MDCLYLSTSHRLGRKYIATCTAWARQLGLSVEALVDEIRFASGHKIQALTSNPEAMRGEGGDVIIDEAAHHHDLAALLKAAAAVGDWGGNLTVISTHNGRENPFNALCEELRAGKRRGSLHRVTIDDALADGLFRRICEVDPRGREWTPAGEAEWRADKLATWGSEEEYLVIPSASGGVYIRLDLIEDCSDPAAPIVRLELQPEHMRRPEGERTEWVLNWCAGEIGPLLKAMPADLRTVLGYDFARSFNGDLSVMAPLQVRRNLNRVCPWLVEMRGVGFEEQWEILQYTIKGIRKFAGAAIDGGGNGSWLGDKALARYGEEMVDVVILSEKWYAAEIPALRASFEEHAILVPGDVDVRDDLLMFRLNPKGIPTLGDTRRRDTRDRKPRHGDAGMALALAHSRCRVAPPEGDFRRVERFPDTEDERRTRLHRDRVERRGGRNRL
jgi:phage FluMu gp28-like protein